MDPLDHLAGPAADLLRRVDGLLAETGAPDDHPIWPLLRRLRTLPGDAVDAVVALRPAPLVVAGRALHGLLHEYGDVSATLARESSWQGAGAEAFATHRTALTAHLTGGAESLAGRLDATAEYAAALADWMAHTRSSLARTLVEVLGSAEAVAVVAGGSGETTAPTTLAAAEIGARALTTVAEAYDQAEMLLHRWAPNLVEVAYRAPADGSMRLDSTIRMVL